MIGIFDSGSGGLTVLRAIRERLPTADVLYFGDVKNAPYGEKRREELSNLTISAMRFLLDRGASAIVSACNSVSASLAISLFDALEIAPQNLIEMVGPTARYFRDSHERLILCATPATIYSGIYQNAFRMIGMDVHCIAIPHLAGAIEFDAGEKEITHIIGKTFAHQKIQEYDTLILACTHYPLVQDAFKKVLGDSIELFDPAEVVAERVEAHLWPREAGDGSMTLAISKDSAHFRAHARKIFGDENFTVEVIE